MQQTSFPRMLAASLAGGLLVACGPLGPIPGGPLPPGSETRAPDNWSYTDDVLLVDLETRGSFFRHSVTTLILASERGVYIPARNGGRKRWVANAMREPLVRVRIDGKTFERRAVRVTDPEELAPLAPLFLVKYIGFESESARFDASPPAPGDTRAELYFFRLDSVEDRI